MIPAERIPFGSGSMISNIEPDPRLARAFLYNRISAVIFTAMFSFGTPYVRYPPVDHSMQEFCIITPGESFFFKSTKNKRIRIINL